jgi:pSer/pThr/pTyr-binding forkhead associated (FHA) protein
MSSDVKLRVTLTFRERRIEVPIGRYVLGRGSECAIRIKEPQVSRKHLELVVKEHSVSVTDLGTKNGTLVNGRPIRTTVLAHGDYIMLGTLELYVNLIPDSEFFEEADTITLTGTKGVSLLEDDIPACPKCEAVLPEADAAHCPFCGHKLHRRSTSYTAELPLLDPDSR